MERALNEAQLRLSPVHVGWQTLQIKGIQQPEEAEGPCWAFAHGTCMIVKLESPEKVPLVSWVSFACHAEHAWRTTCATVRISPE